MRYFSLLTLLAFGYCLFFSSSISAQVTIGSSTPTVEGSLLDIKNKKPTPSDHPLLNADKGLMMPRVKLTKIDELYPMFVGNEADYAAQKKIHTGLIVYNLNATDAPFNDPKNGIGNYVWDGEKWTKVNNQSSPQTVGVVGSKMSDPVMYSYQDLYAPNSYIIKPGVKSEAIKVSKAYAMWDKYRIPANSKIAANKTLSQFKNEPLGNSVSIVLLWQDNAQLFAANSIQQSGSNNGANTTFTITPVAGQTGNAMVGAMIDNKIRWSWHIWVTDYNPDAKNHTLVNTTDQNRYVFMDRNLGATNEILTKEGSMGLMYQWGRKDPFPAATNYTSLVTRPLYDLSGVVALPKNAVVATDLNLVESIVNPTTFYKSSATPASAGSSTFDWYTNLGYATVTGDRTEIMNDQLWDENDRKTPFDPCPKGWRVPTWKNDISAWIYIPANNSIDPASYGNSANFNTLYGLEFTAKADYKIGAYPAVGTIVGETFKQYKVGETGYYWSAEPSTDAINYSFALRFNGQSLHGRESLYRAEGASVRCVKE